MNRFSRAARVPVVLVAVAILIGCTARVPEPSLPTLAPAATVAPGSTPAPTMAACAEAASPAPPVPTEASPPPAASPLVPIGAFPAGDAFEITSVTWTPNGFVAVGFGPMPGEDYFGLRQGIVWTSCDGTQWQRVADPALQYVSPDEVVALGADVYVFGTLTTCAEDFEEECQDVAEAGTVVLRSAAGGAWERLPQAADMKHAFLEGAAAVNGRLATYGTADDELLSATLWLSADGATWTSTTDLAGMDPITALIGRDGGIVAFGSEFIEDLDDIQLMAATSPDGTHFTRADAPALPGGSVDALAIGSGGYVGLGVGYPDESQLALKAVALHSADGNTWTETHASDGSFDGSEIETVHALSNGYVAAGFVIDDTDFTISTGRLWLSADGRSWRAAGDFGTASTAYVTSAMGATGLVVFTADQEETDDADVTSTIGAFFAPAGQLNP